MLISQTKNCLPGRSEGGKRLKRDNYIDFVSTRPAWNVADIGNYLIIYAKESESDSF